MQSESESAKYGNTQGICLWFPIAPMYKLQHKLAHLNTMKTKQGSTSEHSTMQHNTKEHCLTQYKITQINTVQNITCQHNTK